MTITWCRRPAGVSADRRTSSRMSSVAIWARSARVMLTSGWLPASAVWQAWHWPQPPCSHCSAAANASAALERPEPGGPVNSQAWVIP